MQLLSNTDVDDYTRRQAADSLLQIGTGNPQAIDALVQLLSNTDVDDYTRWQVADSLEKIDPGNPQAINALVQLLSNTDVDDSTRTEAASKLTKILGDNDLASVVTALKGNLNPFKAFDKHVYNILWHVAQNQPYPAFYQAWHDNDTMPLALLRKIWSLITVNLRL